MGDEKVRRLKLNNDGDRAVVGFLGEPYAFEVCFVNGRSVPFDEPLRLEGRKPALRFAWNVAAPHTGEVMVWECGRSMYKVIAELRARYPLDSWLYEIERHGVARDPRTTYTVAPKKHLDAFERRALAALPLYELPGAIMGRPNTIDPVAATSIGSVLATLPEEATRRFLSWFGISRVEDLPSGRLESALDRLIALEIEYARTERGVSP